MATGIRIYSDAGSVQIDETYRNACLVGKIPVSLSHNFEVAYHTVSVPGARVLMLMECELYSPFLFNTSFDGTNWNYRWGFNYMGGPTSETATAWVFDYLNSPPADDFGLKVYDAAGAMVFHTSAKPLKIVSVQTHPAGFTGTPGRKYLPLVMLNSYFTASVPPTTIGYTYGLRSSGNVITPDSFAVTIASPAPSTDGLFAAVDVTHY